MSAVTLIVLCPIYAWITFIFSPSATRSEAQVCLRSWKRILYPDVMDIKRIVSIIGYTDRTIRWHIGKGRIFAIIQDRKYLVSKYSLIKFLASDKGFAMQPKSEWHEKAIKWFVEVMYK